MIQVTSRAEKTGADSVKSAYRHRGGHLRGRMVQEAAEVECGLTFTPKCLHPEQVEMI